jgi:apolipoprotein N-acyltransferase
VNVSNDAWFGDSIAPHQHLQMARMRALETGRYMLRSTNTGITAIIDERGNLLKQAPQFKPFVLLGAVQPFAGATPYVRFGNYPVVVLVLVVWAGASAAPLRKAAA